MVLGHLKVAGVRGKVEAHGVLPALILVPEEGDHHLDLIDDDLGQLQTKECSLNFQSGHSQQGVEEYLFFFLFGGYEGGSSFWDLT